MELIIKIAISALVAITLAIIYIVMVGVTAHRPVFIHRHRWTILVLLILLAIDLIFLYLKHDIHL